MDPGSQGMLNIFATFLRLRCQQKHMRTPEFWMYPFQTSKVLADLAEVSRSQSDTETLNQINKRNRICSSKLFRLALKEKKILIHWKLIFQIDFETCLKDDEMFKYVYVWECGKKKGTQARYFTCLGWNDLCWHDVKVTFLFLYNYMYELDSTQ